MTRLAVHLALAIVALAHPHAARAQSPRDSATAPGATVGAFWSANVSTVAVTPSSQGIESRQWNGGGVSVEAPLAGPFSVDVRLMWNRRGARLPFSGVEGFQEVSADYLTAPLLAKVGRAGVVRPYAMGGVELSYRIRARARVVLGAVDVSENARQDIAPVDIGAVVGAGVERTQSGRTLFVEASYAHGLRNVFSETVEGECAKTRTITVLAGVRF